MITDSQKARLLDFALGHAKYAISHASDAVLRDLGLPADDAVAVIEGWYRDLRHAARRDYDDLGTGGTSITLRLSPLPKAKAPDEVIGARIMVEMMRETQSRTMGELFEKAPAMGPEAFEALRQRARAKVLQDDDGVTS